MTDHGLAPGLPAALVPDPAAARPARRVLAQARFDLRIMLRNGEQLLLMIVLPALILVGLARTHVLDLGAHRRIDVVAPGVLALAVMSTAFTGQAISTGFDRRYGVLRLLGTTPLGRAGLVAGRILAVVRIEVIQVVVLGGLALSLGWHPRVAAGLHPAVLGVLLGTAAFVTLGLLLAGTLRAEAVLAVANLVWVLLLAGGGIVIPATHGPVGVIARLLPSGALGEVLRTALLDGRTAWGALAVLLAWTAAAGLAAARWFRWD